MTSTLPASIEWPMMTVLLVVALLRAMFLRAPLDRRLTAILAFWGLVAILRNSYVQDRLADHLVDPSVIRQATHLCSMLASAAMIGAAAVWAAPAERPTDGRASVWQRPETQSLVYIVVFIMGAALFPLSAPARSAGQSLESHGGWQLVAYMTIYAIPTMVAAGAVGFLCFEAARQSRSKLVSFGATLAALVCAISQIDAITWIVTAGLLANGHADAFTRWRTESNYALFLPEVTVVAVVLAVPLFYRLAERLGIDESSRLVRRLQPMWHDLSDAMPMVVLERRPERPDDLAQRMSIEIWDALIRLRGYLPPHLIPSDIPDLSNIAERDRRGILAALAARDAIDAYHAGTPTVSPAATPADLNNLDLEELARGWALSAPMPRSAQQFGLFSR